MVTVIIVVFNAQRYLEQALNSVFNQSYKEFEVIAVDDGSTDGTVDILNKYKGYKNFTLVKKEHTKNLGGNRNQAIKIAKGDYIAFIDGDDIWETDKLAEQIGYVHNYDMICSNASLIGINNEIIAEKYYDKFNSNTEVNLADVVSDNFIRVSTVLIKKTAIEKAGYFEDGPDTRAEDYILWLSYLKFNKIFFINKPLVKYRIHDQNWSNSRPEDWVRLLHRTIDIRRSFFSFQNEQVRRAARIGCAKLYLELVKFDLKNMNYKSARNFMKIFLSFYEPKTSFKYLKYSAGYIYILLLIILKYFKIIQNSK